MVLANPRNVLTLRTQVPRRHRGSLSSRLATFRRERARSNLGSKEGHADLGFAEEWVWWWCCLPASVRLTHTDLRFTEEWVWW